MKLFLTPSVGHLASLIPGEHGRYKIRKFNDGELFLKLEENVEHQAVTVITATYPPAKHFCELFFLLDTLRQQHTTIHVIFTYFGYERQDHPKPCVARAAHIISNCFKQFELEKITIVHPHSQRLSQLITFESIVPYELYIPIVKQLGIDTIVAPDTGAASSCQELAQRTQCLLATIEKERIANNQILPLTVNIPSQTKRALIFDDLISTGATITQAVTLLQARGVEEIYALATHCFLNELNLQKLLESPVKHVWVSNSIPSYCTSPQLTVINIVPALEPLLN
jgi:ribose-phosphate pyrophosphokinase